jgi:phage regulator Rha-like protein
MNAVANVATMTSLEIVELINKERATLFANGEAKKYTELKHNDFMKKAREVVGEGVGNFSQTYQHPQNGQDYPMFSFPKREATLMAMSYSPKISAAVYDAMTAAEARVQELEKPAALALPNFSNPAEAARAWALQYEESLRLSTEVAQQAVIVTQQAVVIEEAKPAVEFMEQYVEADEDYGIQGPWRLLA